MSNEFKIKVGVDLDDSEARSKFSELQNLGKEKIKIEIDIDLKDITKQLNSIAKEFKNAFKIDSTLTSDITKLGNALKKLNDTASGGGTGGGNRSSVSELVSEYKTLATTVEKLQKQMNKGVMDDGSIQRTKALIDDLEAEMNALYNSMNDNSKKRIDLFNAKQSIKGLADINQYMTKIESTAKSLLTQINGINFDHISDVRIKDIKDELEDIITLAKEDVDLDINTGELLNDLNKISTEIKNLEKIENLASNFDKVKSSASEVGAEIKDIGSDIKQLESIADSLDGSFEKAFSGLKNQVKDTQTEVKKISKSSKSSGLLGSIFGSKSDFLGSFAQFTFANVAGDFISDGIRTMVTALKDTIVETDGAITELMKVAPESFSGTGQQLKSYLTEVSEVAKGTGQTSVDIIDGTAKALQSGFSDVDNALKYAQQSAIFANVGDLEQEDADNILASVMSAYGGVDKALQKTTSTVKGANSEYSRLTDFLDQANYAGNKFAVSTADIGVALQQSASALNTNGVTMDENIGMIIAMNEVLQDSSKTGNALKSISSNMSGVNTSLKDGTIQSNKTAKALQEIAGIKVWNEQTGEVRDMYDVMDELAYKWNDLSEAERNALGATIAGKTQLNSFNALMSNWDKARQYVQEYKDGLTVGSAERENERYLDSIAGKWNVIKENMKSVGNTLISSDMTKGFLDGVIVITEGLDKGVKVLSDGLGVVFKKGFSGLFSDIYFDFFDEVDLGGNLQKVLITMNKSIGDFFDSGFGGFLAKINPFQGLIDSLNTGLGNVLQDSQFANKINSTISEIMGQFNGFMTGQMFGMNNGLLEGLLSKGSDLFKGTIGDYFDTKAIEDNIDSTKQSILVTQQEISTLKNQQKALSQVGEEYETLSKKANLSAEEQERLSTIKQTIAQNIPDAVLGYEDDGTPILKSYQSINKELERQNKLKAQTLRLEQNSLANNILSDQKDRLKEYNDAYKEYNELMNETSVSNKKDGFNTFMGKIGGETSQEYAQRILDDQESLNKKRQEAYDKALESYQQYIEDENALQQRAINNLTSNNAYKKLSKNEKQETLDLMSQLDWGDFTSIEADAFAKQLANLGDVNVATSSQMGKSAEKIKQLNESFLNGSINITDYTDGLIESYETVGKFDTESLSNFIQGQKEWLEAGGSVAVAEKNYKKMGETLQKITGIDVDTWIKGFEGMTAPIDASNKALSKFLSNNQASIMNLGKGGLADTLAEQYQTLQSFTSDMANIMATGGTIDFEFANSVKDTLPKEIQNMIDLMGEEEFDADLLLRASVELLEQGEISDELISQIADMLNMSEEEVEAKIKANVEVDGDISEIEDFVKQLDGLDDGEKELILNAIAKGGDEVEELIDDWDNLDDEEKEQRLKQLIEGDDDLKNAEITWNDLDTETKEQVIKQLAEGTGNIDKAREIWENLSEEEKRQLLKQIAENNEKLKQAKETWDNLEEGTKEQIIKQLSEGDVEQAKETWDSLDAETKEQILKQLLEGDIEGAKETWNSLNTEEKTQKLNQEVTGQEEVNSAREEMNQIHDKNASVNVNTTGKEEVDSLRNEMLGVEDKNASVNVNTTGKEEVESTKKSIENVEDKNANVNVNTTGKEEVANVREEMKQIKDTDANVNIKTTADTSVLDRIKNFFGGNNSTQNVKVNVTVSGADTINQLKSNLNSLPTTKTTTVTVSANNFSSLATIKSTLDTLPTQKTVTVTINANTGAITTVTSNLNALPQQKTVNILANASNATAKITTVKSGLTGIQDKTVKILADSSNAMSKINNVKSGLAGIRDKSITITARDNATGVIRSVRNALASISSKTISVRATKTITTVNKVVNVPGTGTQSLSSTIFSKSAKSQLSSIANEDIFRTFSDYNDGFSTMAENDQFTTFARAVSTDPTVATNLTAWSTNMTDAVEYNIELWRELENRIDAVNSKLTILDTQSERATGKEKIDNLKKQIKLYKQQLSLQDYLVEKLQLQQKEIKNTLQSKGFQFTSDGNLNNYEEKILSMERTLTSLEEAYEKAQKTEQDYSGEDENYKKSLSNATEKAREKQQEYSEELNYIKDLLNEYNDITYDTIPNAKEEWEKVTNSIKEAEDEIEQFNKEMQQLKIDAGFTSVDRDVRKVQSDIDILGSKIENLSGQAKIDGLNNMIRLYEQLNNELKDELAYQNRTKTIMQEKLKGLGFDVKYNDKLGTYIENYEQQLVALKNSLNENDFDEVQDLLDEFFDLTLDEIPDLEKQIVDSNNNIYESYEEIAEIEQEIFEQMKQEEREKFQLNIDSNATIINNEIEKLNNRLELLQEKQNGLDGTSLLSNLDQQIALYNKLIDQYKVQLNYEKQLQKTYRDRLANNHGFKFDSGGNITNYIENLEELKGNLTEDDFDYVNELLENYFDTMLNNIPEIEKEIESLGNSIKDVYNEQLDITKEVEDKITEIYEDELEKREEALQESTDKKIEALEKEKQAYKDMRDEMDYQNELEDQQKVIDDLNRQIELAKRDTSLAGQTKLKELMEKLQEEQENFQKLTQDKIDETVENSYDDEIDRLEQANEDMINAMKEQWSDEKIAQAISNALNTGLFTDLNGEVMNLQDKMLEYAEESGEAFGVMGAIVKDELVGNLQIALETMKNISSIYDNLDVENFGNTLNDINQSMNNGSSAKSTVINSSPVFNITTNGSEIDYNEIQDMIDDSNDRLLKEIIKY